MGNRIEWLRGLAGIYVDFVRNGAFIPPFSTDYRPTLTDEQRRLLSGHASDVGTDRYFYDLPDGRHVEISVPLDPERPESALPSQQKELRLHNILYLDTEARVQEYIDWLREHGTYTQGKGRELQATREEFERCKDDDPTLRAEDFKPFLPPADAPEGEATETNLRTLIEQRRHEIRRSINGIVDANAGTVREKSGHYLGTAKRALTGATVHLPDLMYRAQQKLPK